MPKIFSAYLRGLTELRLWLHLAGPRCHANLGVHTARWILYQYAKIKLLGARKIVMQIYLASSSLQFSLSVLHNDTKPVVTPSLPKIWNTKMTPHYDQRQYKVIKWVLPYINTFSHEIGIIQFVLLWHMSFGEFSQFQHFGDNLLFVVSIAKIHQSWYDAVNYWNVSSLKNLNKEKSFHDDIFPRYAWKSTYFCHFN